MKNIIVYIVGLIIIIMGAIDIHYESEANQMEDDDDEWEQ